MKYKNEFYTRNKNELIKESKDELARIENGEPLHKVLGYIEMTNLKINVEKDVLIPRYETEELVFLAKKYINKKSDVLDLCTGSGYIALALKKMTNANITASDISNEAIEQTKINAKINNLDIEVVKSDLFENIKKKFDVIVSNPPYIPEDNKLSDSVINHEPHLALFGGKDGNDIYKLIMKDVFKFLNKDGIIIFEISEDNVDYFRKNNFKIIKDINNKNRIALLSRK
ncbi:peptide chain release factor N(5)-glutamine methyltransferase [Mycoplasma marinum]|uniref:peptide chain release factor N(5)-glutamine methyltransferase n=2 Tax=Mycoplasma marinum TaxID=1937190 RepID=A0A4R0XV74_9MOLU|nr:peptide chain release factor N(5)-glutamine methyltransferase [Mycoplasma marinum]